MADILIRGMEMPESGYVEMLLKVAGGEVYYNYAGEREIKSADYIPLPEGHGRLGDLDKLEESLRMMSEYQAGERKQGILGCCETIRMTKSIVPVEGGTKYDGNAS